jgi:glycosyltransferase involved in cell wall biosynthesis
MSFGVPAVVTNTGGNPYVIEHDVNGLVVPENDCDAFRDAIIRLRNDKTLYNKLFDGALRCYGERFTATEMAKNTEVLYKELWSGTKK